MFRIASLAFLLVLFAAPSALACPHGKHGGFLEFHDGNGDGKVTLAEMRAAAEKHFKSMDANGDGVIDADEIAAARKVHHHHGEGAACDHSDCGHAECKKAGCDHADCNTADCPYHKGHHRHGGKPKR